MVPGPLARENELRALRDEVQDPGAHQSVVDHHVGLGEDLFALEGEQPRIAGVFLKRLHIYMPIQSDTTIQYLLGSQKEEVTIADTKIRSPYNTYQNAGLPPGPIGSPGMDAIKACLNPEATEYLYFVAEKDGHHRFTKTYGEHLKAIADIHKDDAK